MPYLRMESQLRSALSAFHTAEPMRPGMPRAALRGQLPSNVRAEASELALTRLEPPGPREWAERLGVSLQRYRDLVAYLEREGELIRAPGDLWFSKQAVDGLRERVTV